MRYRRTPLHPSIDPRSFRVPRSEFRVGFTLVELLVVVAIIVALLAILLPSMGRAIYTANLAVCGSNIRQIAQGALNYAASNHRAYPYRPTRATGGSKACNLRMGGVDDRPYIRDYIDLNKLINCPLTGEVDWATSNPASAMESPYHLFFGFGYTNEQQMTRVGDAWTFQGRAYSVIVSDRDVIDIGGAYGGYVHGTHPDRKGVMWNEAITNGATPLGGNYTLSRWINYTNSQRGLIDLNFGYADGSVKLLGNLERADGRLTAVPEFANWGRYPAAPTYVPTMQ